MTDYPRKHKWWNDAARLYMGLITRKEASARGVPRMTLPKYAGELDELRQMSEWIHWNHQGRVSPRPAVWQKVPVYAYSILREYETAHPHKPPPPGPPPPLPPPKPPRSWTLPSPLVMSGVHGDDGWHIDPDTGRPYTGIGTIGQIVVPGVCPLWRCTPVHGAGVGWLGQIEGQAQLDVALELLASKPAGDAKAIVGTGNVSADRMVAAGITVAFYELNGQASWEPYGNTNKILFQGHQDGWPYVYPSYGVYVPVSLGDYAAYHPQVTSDGGKTWTTSPTAQGIAEYFAVFSGQGMTDTASWAALAAGA